MLSVGDLRWEVGFIGAVEVEIQTAFHFCYAYGSEMGSRVSVLRSPVCGHRCGRLWGSVGKARPAPSGLETETFHERGFYRLGRPPRNGICVVSDDFTLAIVTGVRVSEMERLSVCHGLSQQGLALSDETVYPKIVSLLVLCRSVVV